MKYKLNCRQIDALINFYNEGCLTELLTKYVKEHLEYCPRCKSMYLKENVIELKDNENKYYSNQFEIFINNLSAYIDNELDDIENIKIKKIAISNQKARQELENSYKLKKALNTAFEKTKNNIKTDYSKEILKNLSDNATSKTDPFYKLAAVFFVMILFLTAGLIRILYF